ncbi:translocation complex subunit Sss1 [Phyllosticta citriasiana]|uniref:translocation complex subunit Sss1 n=1 Tax=Phyllosticta citriasiana TaxID=595635 RepID=UPI0030FDBE23
MSDQLKELADVPKDFIKDGTLFINRCTKRTYISGTSKTRPPSFAPLSEPSCALHTHPSTADKHALTLFAADKREFIKISQAVGIGFVVMGAIGYLVKLVHIPVNNILVGGA